MAQDDADDDDLAGWLCCDRCGAVVPPAADCPDVLPRGLADGSPCPLCGPEPNAPGLRPATREDLERFTGWRGPGG